MQLLELWQMAKLVLKQIVKAHGPLVFSSSLTWDPMGRKFTNATPRVMVLFPPNLF